MKLLTFFVSASLATGLTSAAILKRTDDPTGSDCEGLGKTEGIYWGVIDGSGVCQTLVSCMLASECAACI
jgi:hypothetical protein